MTLVNFLHLFFLQKVWRCQLKITISNYIISYELLKIIFNVTLVSIIAQRTDVLSFEFLRVNKTMKYILP